MASSRCLRLTSLTLANALLPIAVLVFALGFFPYKPVLPGLADWEEDDAGSSEAGVRGDAPFDKVVFMVVDALRSDFVFGNESAMGYVQSLIRDGSAIPFTAHATPPTVTMPRVKALTTGSVPSFLDLILNFAESDTSSSLAAQDTWLAQLRRRGQGREDEKVVFYGDDTWLKLFPGDFFGRSEGTSSFFVSDFTQVDNNVTRHLPAELQKPDWNALIMHYLGLDHIGHKTGPQGPAMLPKQREMDDIVRMIYEAVETQDHLKNTLVVLVGDHGMNAGGNHGGSGPGETEPALVFASPKLAGMQRRDCPATPKHGTEFEFYRKVQQSDVVPTLAGLMGFPVPKNSLGVVLEEVAGGLLASGNQWTRLLRRNARQVVGILEASMGTEKWMTQASRFTHKETKCADFDEEEEMTCLWAKASVLRGGQGENDALLRFLYAAQDALSSTASSYDVPRMFTGIAIAGVSLLFTILAFPTMWPPSLAGSGLTITTLLYGVMMFASSYVEEEQHFWYWTTPAWLALLAMRSMQHEGKTALPNGLSISKATFVLPIMACHRLMVRWNQTGQKHAGEPDVVHGFFPSHHVLMWVLVLSTFLLIGLQLARTSFRGVMAGEAAFSTALVMILPAIVFKLNFTQADAPELVLGLGEKVRAATASLDLVTQARVVFVMLTLATGIVAVGSNWNGKKNGAKAATITLADRLHTLLTLFLITQTRAPNIPLFLLLEAQRFCFSRLLISRDDAIQNSSRALPVALTSLLLSQTTYFAFGGSNSISSIDLSNAYNGVADYNIVAVGVLLFASNWAGAVWWCSASVTLLIPRPAPATSSSTSTSRTKPWIEQERAKLRTDALATASHPTTVTSKTKSIADVDDWTLYTTATTVFTAASLIAIMAACALLRTHLFIWTVFSPKYLYAMAWAVGWHLFVCLGLGRVLWALRGVL
ncbi:hypothetical protein Q7P37_005099 [Cladosporium fusiforme]